MSEDKHPSEMNQLQLYARTVKLSKSTSRMKNPAWYQDALELDFQVHCYLMNEGDVSCFVYSKTLGVYQQIDGLTQRQLQMGDELENFVNRVLECDGAEKAKALGVVFYLADELSIAGLGPEYQNPADLENLRNMMIEEPTEVLDDKTVSSETHAWRLFPYSGAPAGNEFATAVAVSRKHEETLRTLREIGKTRNLPIRTCALSAPLCTIASLPLYTSAKESGTVGIFNYESFTVLSIYNKHADLMMVRYMPHPCGAKSPANLGPAVMASATAFELESPEVNVLSMVGNDLDAMVISLQGSMMSSDILTISTDEILKQQGLDEGIPLEMLVTTMEMDAEIYPLVDNATFTAFEEEGWHRQDFLSPDQDELDMYPSKEDMNLLKLGKNIKRIAALLLIGVLGYAGLSSWNKMRSPAWTFEKQNTQGATISLTAGLKRFEHWDSLLKDRSKAWVNMEFISRLVPADGTVMLKDVKHTVSSNYDNKLKKNGLKKNWVVNGYANDKGLIYLDEISTRDGIKKVFRAVAEDTGSQAFLPDVGQRDITVKMAQRENSTYNTVAPKNQGDRYRLTFTMTITQTYSATDELAIAGSKQNK